MFSERARRNSVLAVSVDELAHTVADGWEIEPPVRRKQVPDRPDGAWYCDIILWRHGRVRLLTVADDHTLRAFFAARTPALEID